MGRNAFRPLHKAAFRGRAEGPGVEKRILGRTGLRVSALGFGCGNVGGLMVRGTAADQERAVARALDLGVNYFDTAAMYGDGRSETNLGRVLSVLRPDIVLATKTRAEPGDPRGIAKTIAASAEESLRRLRRERVDVFQLHTPVTIDSAGNTLSVRAVIDEVIPAFEQLRRQGKIGFYGFSGTGEPAALPHLVATGAFSVAQVIYNLINSSAGGKTFASVGANFAGVLDDMTAAGMGAVAIRVLAAGALADAETRHPIASPGPEPMGSSADYGGDVTVARRLLPLVTEGHVASLVEAALRFAISNRAISTALVGFSDLAQVDEAAAIVNRGPLPARTLARLGDLQLPPAGASRS